MIVSSSRLLRLWDRLTEPAVATLSTDARRKARTLASLLLILIPVLLADILICLVMGESPVPFAVALPPLAFAYWRSHHGRLCEGALISIAVLYIIPGLIAFNTGDPHDNHLLFLLKYPLLNLVVTQLMFPRRVPILIGLTVAGVALFMLRTTYSLLSVLTATDMLVTALTVVGVLVFVRRDDLRERQQAEAQISRSEERYRVLSTLMSDYVYAVRVEPNGESSTEWTAGAVESITGYTPDEAVRLGWSPLLHPDDLPIFMNRLKNLSEGRPDISEYRIRAKQGELRWLRDYGYSVKDEHGERVTGYYGAAQDITERRLAEEALRESEARFRAITDANLVAILITHAADGTVAYCNQEAAALLGGPPEQIVGKVSSLFAFNEQQASTVTAEIAVRGLIINREQQVRRLNGEPFWCSVSVKEIMLDGQPMRLYALLDITERKMAEAALEQSRVKYEDLVNSIDGIVWETEIISHGTTFMSRQVEQMLGYPVERFYREPRFWLDCIHPEDRPRATATTDQAIAQRRSFQQDYRMIAADGHIVWVHDIVKVDTDEHGNLRMRGLALNITASKEAQAAEQEQRRLTEALRNITAVISASLDLNDVMDRILVNLSLVAPIKTVDIMLIEDGVARIARSIGYGQYEAEMMKLRLPVDQTPNLRRMVETGQPLIIADTHAFSDWVDVEASRWIRSMIGAPIRLEWQTIGFLNINADQPNVFTAEHVQSLQTFADHVAIAIRNARLYEKVRRYAEELETLVEARTAELDVERQRIQFILDATGEGVFYTEDFRLHYANAAVCRMMGYTQEQLIGRTLRSLFGENLSHSEKQRFIAVINQLRQEKLWRGEVQFKRGDGSVFDAGLTISVVGEPDEKPLRAVTIVRDITREKALQAQKSRLVAHASHELRTPITNLKTRLYLLRRRPENLEYHLDILDEVTDWMKRLVEDLLDISRLERGVIPLQREKLHVQLLAQRIVQIQQPEAERKSQTISLVAGDTPLYVYGDAERLTQVITNLLTNAINYTPNGGSIRVEVAADDAGRMALIRVVDTGVGIAPDNLPHIFQPFFRVVSEVEGTGLGLSIAKEIVEMHDGTIDVESRVGAGSTFTVRLALMAQTPIASTH